MSNVLTRAEQSKITSKVEAASMVGVRTIRVTPEIASVWLQWNDGNRSASQAHVRNLAKEMSAGNWMLNGQPIVMSNKGRLLDGQHRLMAVEEVDDSIMMDVRFGIDEKSFKTIDQGKGRSAGDVLGIEGVKNYNHVAAASKIIMIYERTGSLGINLNINQRLSNTDILDWVNKNPVIHSTVQTGINLYTFSDRLILTTSKIAAYLYITSNLNPNAEKFWGQLCSGILEQNGTISTLRTKLIRSKLDKSRRLTASLERHFIVKSWNAWINGKELSKLVNTMDGQASPDLFE